MRTTWLRRVARPFRTRSGASVVGALCSAIALFSIFRAGVMNGSAAVVGCWALFQGLFIVSRISDSGAGSNVTRWMATSLRDGRAARLGSVLGAGLLLATGPVVILGVALAFPITWFVSQRYSDVFSQSEFVAMAVYSLLYALVSSAATIVLSVMEGLGGLVMRSYTVASSGLVAMAVVWPLTARDAITGVGQAYLTMALTQLFLGGLGLLRARRAVRPSSKIGLVDVARELSRETFHLSTVGLLRLTFEPVTKLCLSFVGSLDDIAAFDLALRFSTQCRVLIQAALQPLLVLGSRQAGSPLGTEQRKKFLLASGMVAHVTVFLLVIQLLASPVLSYVGFGKVSQSFVVYFAILTLANAINSLGLAGYFLQLSSGDLRPLLNIQLIMSLVNCAGAGAMAWTVGSVGVVVAYGAAFVYGGIACMRLESRILGRSFWSSFEGMPRSDIVGFSAFGVLGVAAALSFHHVNDRLALLVGFVGSLCYCVYWLIRTAPRLRRLYESASSAGTSMTKVM